MEIQNFDPQKVSLENFRVPPWAIVSTPELSIPFALCENCSFYAVNIIIKIVLSFDPHVINRRQDGGQDGCHNYNKRGVFVIKRQSTAA